MAARTWRKGATVLAAGVSVSLVLAACGDDEDDEAGGDVDCTPFEDYGSFDGEEVEIYNSIRDVEADRLGSHPRRFTRHAPLVKRPPSFPRAARSSGGPGRR